MQAHEARLRWAMSFHGRCDWASAVSVVFCIWKYWSYWCDGLAARLQPATMQDMLVSLLVEDVYGCQNSGKQAKKLMSIYTY
ncbi:unnamed protein product [Amaranthus hypochondriacus]